MTLRSPVPWVIAAVVAAALVAAATARPRVTAHSQDATTGRAAATVGSTSGLAVRPFLDSFGTRLASVSVGSVQDVRDEPPTERPLPSPPRRVSIPAIGVEATVIDLGLTKDGELETPDDFDLAGWWAGGTPASHPGPTVIVGHVDSTDGPAVFFRLSELEPGDVVDVVDDHDNVARFVVVQRESYDKDEFPTDRVYGDTEGPTLRLITCGGEFDRSERSYESNVVVYAESI